MPLRHHDLSASAVDHIIAAYQAQALPPIFRLADLPGLTPLHDALLERGFAPAQPTLVQVANSADVADLAPTPRADCTTVPTAAWASVYVAPCFDPIDGRSRLEALSRGRHTVYASIVDQGEAKSAGTAVYSHGWASLHGLRTVLDARGQGLASALMADLAREALTRSLPSMFLQVEEDNQAALSLYQRAGFRTAWRYRYWRTKVS